MGITHPTICLDSLERDGFQVLPKVLDEVEIEELRERIECVSDAPGVRRKRDVLFAVRNLLSATPSLRSFVNGIKMRNIIESALAPDAFLVRAILFDKVPDANWTVPWHQDTAIPVQKRMNAEGFGPWSEKAGVLHVRPPSHVLDHMLTIRVHLDACTSDNGALQVIPGSHRLGRRDESEVSTIVGAGEAHICEVATGDVLLMKPLLLHASRPAKLPQRRRVIHLEFAYELLPSGLEWHAP